jgi:hypothetical protein
MLEEGDLDGARGKYKQSLDVKPTSGGWFNLGVSMSSRVLYNRDTDGYRSASTI